MCSQKRCQQVNCTPTSAGIFSITRAPDEVQSTGGLKTLPRALREASKNDVMICCAETVSCMHYSTRDGCQPPDIHTQCHRRYTSTANVHYIITTILLLLVYYSLHDTFGKISFIGKSFGICITKKYLITRRRRRPIDMVSFSRATSGT